MTDARRQFWEARGFEYFGEGVGYFLMVRPGTLHKVRVYADGRTLFYGPETETYTEIPRDYALVTEPMQRAGNAIANDLFDAQICRSMNGLGGGKTWAEWSERFKGENKDLIEQFVNDEIDSVTAIYRAMWRAI